MSFFICTFAIDFGNAMVMNKILSVILGCLVSLNLFAVMASPEPIEVTQPDGSILHVRLVGDEFHNYYTLLDGTPICQNDKGEWTTDFSIAKESASIQKVRRGFQEKQVSSTFPLTGSPKSVVILVNFADLEFNHTLDDFQKMLNESGYSANGGVGSARDYFIACSDSVFSPIFDCYGPVTLSKGYAYYGGNSGDNSSVHASQMVIEACTLVADELGVDMSQYDTNNDGRLDNVFIYYAGHNEAEHGGENTIWPHRSYITSGDRVSGKLIYDYACSSELRGPSGNAMCGIGTFCHEFGHVLGLPDYYDTGYNYYTVGAWDIMCSGSYNGNGKMPPSYSAGERFQLGWLTPIQLKEAGPYTLEPLETSNKAYLIAATDHNLSWEDASPSEYWLLENRQALGWDAASEALPGTGMLIWHIDYNAAAWGRNQPNNSLPLRYDIEEAGGKKGYAAPSDPFPGTFNVMQFTPVLHNNTIVEQPLLNIGQDGENITFIFKSSGTDNFMILPTELPILQSTYNSSSKEAETPAEKLKIIGSHLDPNEQVTISISGNGFYLSVDSSAWKNNISVPVEADSTMEQVLYVRYAPKKQICDVQRGTITMRQTKAVGSYIVLGTSPRPILIDAPSVDSLYEVTPTSFKVHWEPEKDAEFYYVTLYHMEDGSETTMESFEGFDDEAIVHEAGWYSSFFRTTTKAKEEGLVSMWFKEDGERMLSPIYNMPVIEVSMWLNAPATTDNEVGWIILSGIGENSTYVLDTIEIKKSTKKYTYQRSLDENMGIRRFEIRYASFGGEGVCVDAFTTTFNQKTVYTYKGRERTIEAQEGKQAAHYTAFYAYDLIPETAYYLQLQCSENKGCQEHLSDLSMPMVIFTKKGEEADSKRLTIDCDSLSYDYKTHVVYIPQSLSTGSVAIYSVEGELVKTIPVDPTQNVVILPENELRRGMVYIIKYMPGNRLRRKNPWIKILFR